MKSCTRFRAVTSGDELTRELAQPPSMLLKYCCEARDKLLLGGFPGFHNTKQLSLLLQGSWEKNWFTCRQSSPFLHSVTVPLFPLQIDRLQNVILHKQTEEKRKFLYDVCLASRAEGLGNVRVEILNKCSQQVSDLLKLFTTKATLS